MVVLFSFGFDGGYTFLVVVLFSRGFDCGCSPILSPGQSRWGERQEVEPVHNFDHSFTVSVFHQFYWSRQRLRKFYSLYLGELFGEVG